MAVECSTKKWSQSSVAKAKGVAQRSLGLRLRLQTKVVRTCGELESSPMPVSVVGVTSVSAKDSASVESLVSCI